MLLVGEAGIRLRPVADRFASEADAEVSSGIPGVAKKAAGFFVAAFAAVKIGGFIKDAIGQASDLSESASKAQVVFGAATKSVVAFASNSATALGLSRQQALEAVGTFGNLGVSLGLGQQKSADMSTHLVKLAGDLASFNNVDPNVALDALRSGLVGETEPLRQFGINLNQAALKQEAMRLGLDVSGTTLKAATASQAAYSLIMKQSTTAQGDFQRTSAGLANQQRIASAQFKDLSANVGGLFVPVVANASGILTGHLMPAFLHLTENLPKLGTALGQTGDVFRAAFDGDDRQVTKILNSTLGLGNGVVALASDAGNLGAVFHEAFANGQAGADLLASHSIEGLTARVAIAGRTVTDTLGASFVDLRSQVAPVLGHLGASFGGAFTQIKASIGGAFGGGGGGGLQVFGSVLGKIVDAILPLFVNYIQKWASVIQAAIPVITALITGLAPVFQDLFAQIGPLFKTLGPVISQVGGILTGVLVVALKAILPVVPVLVSAIGQVVQLLAGAFMSILQALVPIIPPLVAAIAQIAGALAGALAQALQAIIPIIPTLIGVIITLVQAAIVPLLPLLPLLAGLFAQIIVALVPIIPPLIQIIMLIIQLVIAAIVPLMPLIPVVIGLFTLLIRAIMPIIGVLVSVIGWFVKLAAAVVGVVVGFVSTLIGVWTSLFTGIARIVGNIVGGVTGGFTGLVRGVKGIFSGIADFVGGMFQGIGTAIKAAINGIITLINNTTIRAINIVIRGVNLVNPFDDIPYVPNIPKFHAGGVFAAPAGRTQGIAVLRNDETIVTPEDRDRAAALIVAATGGRLPAPSSAGAAGTAPGVTINEHLHLPEGVSPGEVAAATSSAVAWNFRAGVSRLPGLVPAGAGAVT